MRRACLTLLLVVVAWPLAGVRVPWTTPVAAGIERLERSSVEATEPQVTGAPSGLMVSGMRGQVVDLAWRRPADGPQPTGYVISGGMAPGDVLAQIPTGSGAPSFTLTLPPGTFYIRVHATIGANPGPPSNEVRVHVEVPALPFPPMNLLGMVDGSSIALSWRNNFGGGEPQRLRLRVTGAVSTTVPLPVTDRFTVGGIAPGTYALSLVAENAYGVSGPSNVVTLTVPGTCSGPPGPPTNFQTWTIDSRVFVSWDPPTTGPAVTGYRVRVTGAWVGSVETTARAVSGELAAAGTYAISVTATNPCGEGPATPAAPDWTTVVRQGTQHVVHWAPSPHVGGYRVYWSTSRAGLDALGTAPPFVDATQPPVMLTAPDATQPVYYRVFPIYGHVIGTGGPTALAGPFEPIEHTDWPGRVTPALWDLNGDGCLDLVGGWGGCDGSFTRYALASIGLQGLVAPGRRNRDSRIADFTGDGIPDIFTNVYARADQPGPSAILHVGSANGTFTEDPAMAAHQIRGFGETVVAADFDNDGDIDLFVPHYSHLDDGGRNWLLINDGTGHFTDVAHAAGVAINQYVPPEGAQAIDINEDGWVDIHVASHLFINHGDLTFTDAAAAYGLPIRFEEGMRLFDVDLDGDLDLVHHDTEVTRLHVNRNGVFDAGVAIDGTAGGHTFGYGLNVCDINGDGFEDLLVANNDRAGGVGMPRLFVNVGGALIRSDLVAAAPVYNDLLACADLDASGLPDVVGRWSDAPPEGQELRLVRYRTYVTRGTPGGAIRLRVVGQGGARNQQGRVVHVRALDGPDRTLLRVVESGSAYMSQNDYDLLVAAPWPGPYEVAVRFANGWVRATARAGDALTLYANGMTAPGLR